MCEIVDVLLGDQCGTNQGGTKLKVHYAQLSDFLSLKKPAANAVGVAKYKITEAHTFNTGKAFKTIEIVKNTGSFNMTPGGENSGTKNGNLVFRVPSNNENALVLFNMANGILPLIFLVEDANMPDGTYDQIGTEKQYATITAQKVSGANEGEGGMYEFTVAQTGSGRLLYAAAVTTQAAA